MRLNDRRLFNPLQFSTAQALLVILTLLVPLLPAGMTSAWKTAARDAVAPGCLILRKLQVHLAAPISRQMTGLFQHSASNDLRTAELSENSASILGQKLDLEREKNHRLTALLLTQSYTSNSLLPETSISPESSRIVPISFEHADFEQTSNSSRLRAGSKRLFVADLIEATLLGSELSRNWKSGAIIARGSRQGIEESAWVVKSSEPLLDLGHDHNIATADLVLTAGLVVVGKVERVGNWTSTFLPVTHSRFRCRAMVVRQAENSTVSQKPTILTQTILAGDGTQTCRLEKISDNVGLRVGDEVYSLEDDGLLNRPLFLGTITKATLPAEDRYWEVQVTPEYLHPAFTTSDPQVSSSSVVTTASTPSPPFPARLSILRLRPNSSRFENDSPSSQGVLP